MGKAVLCGQNHMIGMKLAVLKWHFGLLLGLMAVVSQVNGTTYTNFLEDGGWAAHSSVFECSLVHGVPHYGDAVFKTRAGESSSFYLKAQSSRFRSGQASLIAQAPAWSEQPQQMDLGFVRVTQGLKPVKLGSSRAEQMLLELFNGFELVFTRQAWYPAEVSSQVAITTIGFRSVYRSYLGCLAGLLPVNFDQIKRTAVYFGSAQYEDFGESELKKLDHIALYIKADPSIKEFYIDGHTDSVGARDENLVLAQQRAEEVTKYLVNKGVPKEYITSRWHGERYPIVGNDSVMGRAKNRRVTIRLEKIEAPSNE